MINRYILIILISAFLLIGLAGAASGADIARNPAENLAISGITQDTSPSLNVQDGAGTMSTTVSNPRAPVRKRPTITKTPVPTRVTTTAPTTVSTTITTTVPAKALTTIPTTVPITTTATPNQVEIQARVDAAYADGYARLAEMQAAHHSWSVPSRPDLVAIATNAKSAGLKGDGVTDDTVALQALLNQLPAGSTIYFPPAHYRIDGPITIAKPFTLFGESGTIFDCQKATKYVFTINKMGSLSLKMGGVSITGIVVEGPGIETSPAMFDAYYLQGVHFSFVKFHNIGYTAISLNGCIEAVVEDCVFDNIYREGDGADIYITDYSDGITVRDNFFVTKGRHAVTTGTSDRSLSEEGYSRRVTVENNYIENTETSAIDSHTQTIGPYVVRGNVVFNSGYAVSFRAGIVDVSDNIFINCGRGIRFLNMAVDPASIGPKIDRAVNNTMINISAIGIEVDKTNFLIKNNIIQSRALGYGIYHGPSAYTSDYALITENVLENWLDGFYREHVPSPTMSPSDVSMVNNWMKSKGIYGEVVE